MPARVDARNAAGAPAPRDAGTILVLLAWCGVQWRCNAVLSFAS
jgi:hypothetical protein